jgi:regulator of sigma E protease
VDIIALTLLPSLGQIVNVLTVVVGLGLVIFFHELGHFAVAKWCNVLVERFSIGFGPILWRRKWGETEYALSAIPFGGYVKMLGQDDIDPSQLTSEEVAQDPRSYTSKSVPQRMAIISAGVIMNIVTGMLFFVTAFRSGVEVTPALVGDVQVGMPAWRAGIRTGDRITEINGRDIEDFNDLLRATALSSGPLDVKFVRGDGTTEQVRLSPDLSGTRRRIGVAPAYGLKVLKLPETQDIPSTVPGSAAAAAEPAIQPGDVIRAVDGQDVATYADLQEVLALRRADAVSLTLERTVREGEQPQSAEARVPAAPFRTLGLKMDIGTIVALQDGSPADRAGLQIGDRLAFIDGLDIGRDIDPLRLPDYLADHAGTQVTLKLRRVVPGGGSREEEVTLVPVARAGWTEPPEFEETPLAASSIGIAYHVRPVVLVVEDGGPAAAAGILQNESITRLELVRPANAPPDGLTAETITIEVGENNWAYAFWQMQQFPARQVRLTVQSAGSSDFRTVDIAPAEAADWYLPSTRGLLLVGDSIPRKANSLGQAISMGWQHTRSSIIDIYLTLRSLVARRLSVKELHGPLGILKVASDVAQVGLVPFLLFLGFLSINLAVLNFLPIPVLDGGHMVFLLWEGIVRKRPSERVVVAATLAGMMFVFGLMALVLYLDFVRLYDGKL